MNPAQATRLEKEKHPERFCPDKKCLRRIAYPKGIIPCPKHMAKEIDLMEALKKSLKATTATPIVIGSKVRRIDEPYVVLHVREIDTEGTGNDGMPKALCFNSFGHGKWMLLTDLEAAS